MVRFWLRFAAVIAIAAAGLACTGQNIQGRWRGAFPLEGCETGVLNLYGDERFDLACDQDLWIGSGRYKQTSDSLQLDFTILLRRGVRVERLPKIACRLDGRGNEIVLSQAGQQYSLRRRMN